MLATVYIATTLDGFIARDNGDLDWLPGAGEAFEGEDYGYGAFMKTVDALIMGRKTYEKVLTFDRWLYDKPVIVLANSPIEIPSHARDVEQMSGTPAEVAARLSARGIHHVYVDGGVTIQRFLAAGAVQRLILTRVPVLIGQGIPLFGALPHDVVLHHAETHSYPNGLVQSIYDVVRQPARA